MSVESRLQDEIVSRCCDAIVANADLLTRLDQAIGDGDHGTNMSRGFEALRQSFAAERDADFPTLCNALGMALVMNIGGAAGPLFGSMVLEFRHARSLPLTRERAHHMLWAGVEAVKKRGKSDVGAKTMLDVLVPVCDELERGNATLDDLRQRADQALEKTRDMMATKGRSAFLGPRSVGHLDPGAQSSCLLIHAVCDAVEAINER